MRRPSPPHLYPSLKEDKFVSQGDCCGDKGEGDIKGDSRGAESAVADWITLSPSPPRFLLHEHLCNWPALSAFLLVWTQSAGWNYLLAPGKLSMISDLSILCSTVTFADPPTLHDHHKRTRDGTAGICFRKKRRVTHTCSWSLTSFISVQFIFKIAYCTAAVWTLFHCTQRSFWAISTAFYLAIMPPVISKH